MEVNVGDWLAESRRRVRRDGFRGVVESVYYLYAGLVLSVTSHVDVGTNVFDRDWDLLVILDACRVDALRAVADEYEFVDDVTSVWSVASTSPEWHVLTFRERYVEEIADTAYVTANVQFEKVMYERRAPPTTTTAPLSPSFESYGVVRPENFGHLDLTYRYAHDEAVGVVRPRDLTDRAIDVWRSVRPRRQIVHYMQPHTPYVGDDDPPEDALQRLQAGEVSRTEVWDAYLDTLRLVLDDVALLLENVDADRVVITADHGEAMGEWGFHSHNVACPQPVVRKVPWVVTSASDEGTHEPSLEPPDETVEADTRSQLEDLGYL